LIKFFLYQKINFSLLFLLVPFLSAATVVAKEVVVYTSVDQVFSEPILTLFEERSGIKVKAVYDVEAAKTVGLINRLLAERKSPRADVFWNSEITRTITLQNKGILQPYRSPERDSIPSAFKDKEGYWAGFGCRGRVFIYNSELIRKEDVPRSMLELTQPEWKGRFAMAYPLLGTAATHMGALYAYMGKERAEIYLRNLVKNDVVIVAGNSVVRDIVADGEVMFGLTDTDDVMVAIKRNQPVDMIFPDQEGMGTYMIPNSVAMIKNCPHPENAKILIDFLLSREVEVLLAESESANIPVRKDLQHHGILPAMDKLNIMDVDYKEAAAFVPVADRFNRQLFAY